MSTLNPFCSRPTRDVACAQPDFTATIPAAPMLNDTSMSFNRDSTALNARLSKTLSAVPCAKFIAESIVIAWLPLTNEPSAQLGWRASHYLKEARSPSNKSLSLLPLYNYGRHNLIFPGKRMPVIKTHTEEAFIITLLEPEEEEERLRHQQK